LANLIQISTIPTSEARGDVILVHGVGGNHRATWQVADDRNLFWPSWLATDVPNVNIWSLDYHVEAIEWKSKTMPLPDRAINILATLETSGIGQRPIVFVTHSFGGLLVKQLLRSAVDYRQEAWSTIAKQTKGVVFISTPHAGSEKANWLKHLASLLGTVTLDELRVHDPNLGDLNIWYRSNVTSMGIATEVHYEKRSTGGLRIVDETSSDPGIPRVVPIPWDADHITICKFSSRQEPLYLRLRKFIENSLTIGSPGEGHRTPIGGSDADLQEEPLGHRKPLGYGNRGLGASSSRSSGLRNALDLNRPITVKRVRKQEKINANIIANVAFHPDGDLMAYSLDNRLFLLPLNDVFPERLGIHENAKHSPTESPHPSPREILPDPADGEEFLKSAREEAHSVKITGVCFSPDGRLVASSDNDGYIKFWSLASRECVAELSEHSDVVTGISFSPHGDLFASAGYDELVCVWRLDAILSNRSTPFRTFIKKSKIKKPARFPHDIEQIISMTFSHNGKHLASGDQQGVVVVREVLSGEETFRYKIHNGMVNSLCFSPGERRLLATASDDSRIRLTDCYTGSPETLGIMADKHTGPVMSIAFSHGGEILVSSASDNKIKLWDVAGRKLLNTHPSEDDRPVEKVAFCPNRYDFATDSYDSNISLWGISNAGDITNTRIIVD
jgi:WD40 repeat protein